MSNTFLYADPHFGHHGVCRFTREDGSPLRPWDTIEEMDEAMVELYNKTVQPKDKVYFLGDVVINRRALPILSRLNGDKILVKGNHDIFKLNEYAEYFRDVRAYHVLNGMMLSHIPIHAESLARFGCNIHGHTHYRRVCKPSGFDAETGKVLYSNEIDPRYFCVSVECIEYTPISLEEVQKQITEQGGVSGFLS